MTKKTFIKIDQENEYIHNLLKTHKHEIVKRLRSFFDPLYEKVNAHGYFICVHTNYHPIHTHIYNGTKADSHKLVIEDFKIIEQTDGFPDDVLEIVTEWLGEIK